MRPYSDLEEVQILEYMDFAEQYGVKYQIEQSCVVKKFLERNPGMRSRIAFYVGFEDYSTDELCEITHLMLSKKNMAITEDAMDKLRRMYDVARINQDYGNGRYVRKLLEEAEMNLANRVISLPEDELTSEAISTINASDIPEFKLEKRAEFRIGFAS